MKKGKWDPEDWGCIFLILLVCGVILTPILAWWWPYLSRCADWLYNILH